MKCRLFSFSVPSGYYGLPTVHAEERLSRFQEYQPYLDSPIVLTLIVDRDHDNGPEYHVINQDGIALVYNVASKRLITVKALRPGQLEQYAESLEPSESLEDAKAVLRNLRAVCHRNRNLNLNNK